MKTLLIITILLLQSCGSFKRIEAKAKESGKRIQHKSEDAIVEEIEKGTDEVINCIEDDGDCLNLRKLK